MPVTLADARLLTRDNLTQFLIDEFRKDNLLERMIFDDNATMNGGSTLNYVYSRVTRRRSADFREINTEYTAADAATTQFVATLKPFGGTFAVDRVIANYVKGVTDQVTFQMQQLVQATTAKFSDAFMNGDSAVDAKSFDGLDKAIAGSTTDITPASVIDLSSSALIDANWKVFLDQLRRLMPLLDTSPTMLLVNAEMHSIFQSIADRAASFTITRNEIGSEIMQWNGIPIIALGDKPASSDPIIATDSGKTAVYAVRIGLDGAHAISPLGGSVINSWLPNFADVNAVQTGGVEMVAAMALKATRAAGVIRDIKIA